MRVERPTSVTLVSLLALLSGVLNVLGGVLLLVAGFANSLPEGYTSRGPVIILGALLLLVGLGILWVYRGLKAGRSSARLIFVVLLAIAMIVDVIHLFQGRQQGPAAFGIIIDALAIFVLYGTASARKFFR